MSDDRDAQRNPLDQALDMFFYAPIGLALNAEEMLRQMAERGRQSVTAARFIGRMAVQQGRTEVDKALDRLQDQAATLIDQLGHLSADARSGPAPTSTATTAKPEPDPAPVPVFDPAVEAAIDDPGVDVLADSTGEEPVLTVEPEPAMAGEAWKVAPEADVDDADTDDQTDDDIVPALDVSVVEVNRAIPDYDSLAASQVVPRLAGLTPTELETIRGYETAHRARTTVLNRIAQLQRS